MKVTGRGLYETFIQLQAELMVEIDPWDALSSDDHMAWNRLADRLNSKPEEIG